MASATPQPKRFFGRKRQHTAGFGYPLDLQFFIHHGFRNARIAPIGFSGGPHQSPHVTLVLVRGPLPSEPPSTTVAAPMEAPGTITMRSLA